MSALESMSWEVSYPPALDFGQQHTREQLFSSMKTTMSRHQG
ncbi:gamma-glutamylcyclotransferase, partial [Pseudomonas sp. FW305-17]